MRKLVAALRHILGVIVTSFCALALIGGVAAIIRPEPDAPRIVGAITIVFGIILAGVSFWLLRPSLRYNPEPCPRCGERSSTPAGILRRSRSFLLRHTGGLLLEALWG